MPSACVDVLSCDMGEKGTKENDPDLPVTEDQDLPLFGPWMMVQKQGMAKGKSTKRVDHHRRNSVSVETREPKNNGASGSHDPMPVNVSGWASHTGAKMGNSFAVLEEMDAGGGEKVVTDPDLAVIGVASPPVYDVRASPLAPSGMAGSNLDLHMTDLIFPAQGLDAVTQGAHQESVPTPVKHLNRRMERKSRANSGLVSAPSHEVIQKESSHSLESSGSGAFVFGQFLPSPGADMVGVSEGGLGHGSVTLEGSGLLIPSPPPGFQ